LGRPSVVDGARCLMGARRTLPSSDLRSGWVDGSGLDSGMGRRQDVLGDQGLSAAAA
jgi:hypothetical protein